MPYYMRYTPVPGLHKAAINQMVIELVFSEESGAYDACVRDVHGSRVYREYQNAYWNHDEDTGNIG